MKFSALYPDAEPMEMLTNGIMCGYPDREHPCWHCGESTHFMDVDFQAYLCSQECQKAKYRELPRWGPLGNTPRLVRDD